MGRQLLGDLLELGRGVGRGRELSGGSGRVGGYVGGLLGALRRRRRELLRGLPGLVGGQRGVLLRGHRLAADLRHSVELFGGHVLVDDGVGLALGLGLGLIDLLSGAGDLLRHLLIELLGFALDLLPGLIGRLLDRLVGLLLGGLGQRLGLCRDLLGLGVGGRKVGLNLLLLLFEGEVHRVRGGVHELLRLAGGVAPQLG